MLCVADCVMQQCTVEKSEIYRKSKQDCFQVECCGAHDASCMQPLCACCWQPEARSYGVFTSHSSAGASTEEGKNVVSHQLKWCSWDSGMRGETQTSSNNWASPRVNHLVDNGGCPAKTCQDALEECGLHTYNQATCFAIHELFSQSLDVKISERATHTTD